jgi:hypothetical protein
LTFERKNHFSCGFVETWKRQAEQEDSSF